MKPTNLPTQRVGSTLGGDVKASERTLAGLDIVGDRWSMWVLAAVDPQHGSRFVDLLAAPRLSRRVLAERLNSLVAAALLEREAYQQHPRRYRYCLTARGRVAHLQCQVLLHIAGGGSLDAIPTAAVQPGIASGQADVHSAATHPADALLARDQQYAVQIYAETIKVLEAYDAQYRTELVHTLATYLNCDASVQIAAARLYAHRHTVRYRLDRIHELSGLDVDTVIDRERLTLGLRARRFLKNP